MPTLLERVKDRKLIQWTLAYVMGCWVLLQVLGELAEIVAWVDAIRPTALVAMLLGLPVVLVLAWYHGEKGRQRVRGRELLVLATVLAVVGLGIWAVRRSPASGSALAGAPADPVAAPAPAIAVLPAIGSGSGSDQIAEGITSVLSTGLDAVPGWRAVSPRTVRARWIEAVGEGGSADEATALAIARASGGRYAVMPTATVLGPAVRVTAAVYDLAEAGEPPVAIEVEGSTDDLLPLADELAVQVLGAVLRDEGEIPDVDLTRTSSASPEALRAFLRGEVAYRNFQLETARDAFNEALDHDPGFARAHYRLYEVHNWGVTWDTGKMREHTLGALELIDRLTEREALVIRGLAAADMRESEGYLREAVAKYPDDATAWNLLGERLIHRLPLFATEDELTEVFGRSVELDPQRAGLYPHAVGLAFGEAVDSAHATRLVRAFETAAGGVEGDVRFDLDPRAGDLALRLAFGDESTRGEAQAELESLAVGPQSDRAAAVFIYLAHPRYVERIRRMLESLRELPPFSAMFPLDAQYRGRLALALDDVDSLIDDPIGLRALYGGSIMGLPVHEELLDTAFGPGRIVPDASLTQLALSGYHAANVGRWGDFDRVLEILESRLPPEPEGSLALGLLEKVRAYGVWKRGNPEEALEELADLTSPGSPSTENSMWHLGLLYMELERWEDAERVFRTGAAGGITTPPFWWNPLARRNLGIALEAQGRDAEAAVAYRYFVEHWYDADPELQPMVEDARERIRRLDPSNQADSSRGPDTSDDS
ncbi:MAG: tetratricopeptide repeat protein [Gemmatimonadota bacterium]|nr:tetratricopeptide repeat protein [Gemmatimonadota bacterium]